MKVKDLIKELEKQNPEAKVECEYHKYSSADDSVGMYSTTEITTVISGAELAKRPRDFLRTSYGPNSRVVVITSQFC